MIQHLDLFVHDELTGLDVRSRHPRAWQHMQVCTDCRAEHDSLLEMLAAEAAGKLEALPPLRIATSPPSAAPWRVVIEATPILSRPVLLFVFSPAYLQRSLQALGTSAAGRRVPEPPRRDTLLLSYLGDPGTGEVTVRVYARLLPGDDARYTLALLAIGKPMPRAAELTWGGQVWQRQLSADGDAEFGPLPLAALSQSSSEAFSLRLLP
ncbi:MAG: hypothetical protein NT169_05510 [Chloroflexi bacterium]|nr:hypothetical protein [Chloroflexota bacterium]